MNNHSKPLDLIIAHARDAEPSIQWSRHLLTYDLILQTGDQFHCKNQCYCEFFKFIPEHRDHENSLKSDRSNNRALHVIPERQPLKFNNSDTYCSKYNLATRCNVLLYEAC